MQTAGSAISVLVFVIASIGIPSARAFALTGPVSAIAKHLAESGRTDEAIAILKKELQNHPAELEPRLALADIYVNQRDLITAEAEYRQALSWHPRSSTAALALGNLYLGIGSLDAAEHVFAELLSREPALDDARIQLTSALAAEHKYAEAARNLSLVHVPAIPVKRVRYYRMAASVHSGLGQKQSAAHDMENALAAAPQDEQLQMLAAMTEADAANWRNCAQHLRPLFSKYATMQLGLLLLQAQLALREDFTETLQRLRAIPLSNDQSLELSVRSAELLSQSDEHKDAVEELRRAHHLASEDRNITFDLATELYASGDTASALPILAALREHEDSAETEDLIADCEDSVGDSASAIHAREKAVNLAPAEERYRLSLGAALLKLHSFQAAQQAFQKSIDSFPNSARGYVGLGMAQYMMERYEESSTALLQAIRLDSHAARILNYLGSTQSENPNGPSQSAIDAMCARADSYPRDSVPVKWCGAMLFRQAYASGAPTSTQSAIAHLRSAAALDPKDPVAACFLGRALFWTGRVIDARHALETCVRLEPDSSEEHYRLSLVYQELNLREAAAKESASAVFLKASSQQFRSGNDIDLQLLSNPAQTRPNARRIAERAQTSK